MLSFVLTMLIAHMGYTPQVTLLPAAQQAEWLAAMPRTFSGRLEKALKMEFILYDKSVMPPAYQYANGSESTFIHIDHKIAADLDPVGHANGEHPWQTGLGLDRCNGAQKMFLIAFPKTGLPLQWSWDILTDSNRDALIEPRPQGNPIGHLRNTSYPPGTTTAELIATRDPDTGRLWVQILRTQVKLEDGSRSIATEAPLATAGDFVKYVSYSGLESDKEVLASHYKRPTVDILSVSLPKISGLLPFRGRASRQKFEYVDDNIPALSKITTRKILSRPFTKLDESKPWMETARGDIFTYSPTTAADFSIVPKNYAGGYLPPTKANCMICHEQVLASVAEIDNGRDWYGRVRGMDTVFSFYFEDPATISYNGAAVRTALRKVFVDAGIVSPNPKR